MTRWRLRGRSEDGLLGGVDALAFGALVFIAGTILVLNAWSVVDARMAVGAAAREAVRTIVEDTSGDLAGGQAQIADLEQRARDNAATAMTQHGKDVDAQPLAVAFEPLDENLRCATVRVAVTWKAPAIALPFVGVFRDGIDVTIEHQGRIDPFRAGVAGEVSCA